MNLRDVFRNAAVKMRADFEASCAAQSHPGSKGSANEEAVRAFLTQYLPRTLDVSTGTAIDCKGKQSRQLDVTITDTARTPILYEKANLRTIPVECLYAVIEVKADLSKTEMSKAYRNMKSVKTLIKKAYFPTKGARITHTLYEDKWDAWPVQYFIMAYKSPDLRSVTKNLHDLQSADPLHQRIDMVCVLDRGVVANRNPANGVVTATATEQTEMKCVNTPHGLLLFYSLMSMILNQARMQPFNIEPYLKSVDWSTV